MLYITFVFACSNKVLLFFQKKKKKIHQIQIPYPNIHKMYIYIYIYIFFFEKIIILIRTHKYKGTFGTLNVDYNTNGNLYYQE